MKYKTLLTICLIACVLFTISSVNAIDENETTIANEDTHQVIQDNNLETINVNNKYETLTLSNENILQESQTLYVDGSSESSTEDGSQNNPYKTFKAAYNAANSGDTINIAPGIYKGTDNLGFSISNKENLKIQATGSNVIFDGDGGIYTTDVYGREVNPSLLTIQSDNVVIDGITFINGHVSGDGTALNIVGSYVKILNCKFKSNSADGKGGAIYIYKWNNVDNWGYEVQISNCEFESNSANNGGAIYWDGNNGKLNNCIFKSNHASSQGDNIYYVGESGIISNCKYYSGTNGNGLYSESNSLSINGFDLVKTTSDTNSQSSSSSSKTTKLTPKLTAKAATFKVKTKTKKYSVILKTNKNKAMNKVKLYLKVNGKTFTAKTNSKGKAIFKITNLKKKKTFKATITYKGNTNYKKVTKTIKIKCK